MSGEYTDEELNGLSEEERAALTGEEADTTDEALQDIAGDDENGDDDAGADGDDKDQGADGQNNADDADADLGNADAGSDDQGTTDADTDDAGSDVVNDEIVIPDDIPTVKVDPFVPKISGEVLPEYQAKIDALDAKYEDGTLPMAEHRKEVRKLEAASQNAEIQAQLEAHTQGTWKKEQAVFLDKNPQFRDTKNRILFGALNQEVIRLANDERTVGMTGLQILYAAKANVDKEIGAVTGKPPVIPAKVDDKKAGGNKPKAAKPTHQTLADIPAAAANDTEGDRFAYLDKLDGLVIEAALNKLSDTDRQAYLDGR